MSNKLSFFTKIWEHDWSHETDIRFSSLNLMFICVMMVRLSLL